MTHARRIALALALACAFAATNGRAQECPAPRPLVPVMLTPISAPMPRDGGGIVAGIHAGDAGAAAPASPSFEGVTLARRRTTQTLQVVTLAPGLFRLAPTASLSTGAWTLHGIGADAEITVGRTPLPGAPVRPNVRGMRRVAATSMSATATPRVEVRAITDFPVPPGVVAMLVYWNGETSPSSWVRATLSTTEMVVYTEPDACTPVPDGSRAPPVLDGSAPLTGAVAFVDQFGQVSPISAAVAVE